MDTDHYNEDTPSESHSAAEWRQAHRDVVSQQSGGTISSLSGTERSTRTPMEATDGVNANALAALGDAALPVPVAGETAGAGYDGDQSGDEERSTGEGSAGTPH